MLIVALLEHGSQQDLEKLLFSGLAFTHAMASTVL